MREEPRETPWSAAGSVSATPPSDEIARANTDAVPSVCPSKVSSALVRRSATALRGAVTLIRRTVKWGTPPLVVLWIAWLLLPKPELLPPGAGFSRMVLDREQRVLFLTLTPDEKYRLPAKLSELSPELLAATLEMEDRRFFSHHGADPRSLVRSAWGVVSGQRLGGGSTLTMQYARLRWHLDTRSLRGKLVQIFRAVQLERHYGKTDLAEAYFTFAPYGGNVEGIEAASRLLCGKSARELSMREAAALSVLPQSPTKRRPRVEGNPALAAAQARLMARLRIARGQPVSSLDGEFLLRPVRAPRVTPHLARRILSDKPGILPAVSALVHEPGAAPGSAAVLRTTLDATQQESIERSIADFLAREHARGLRNASAILVHAPTREVRAYVGSAGFYNEAIQGQVDGVKARRSPGSALKPFIYGLAFDAGIIQPRTLLDDAPRRFAGYNPENSDRGFLGPIPASEALRRSRNVPAVELLARLPGGGLDEFLRQQGVRLQQPPGKYGLSLALGGAEVSLEELAMLYAGLAAPRERKGALSPSACWLVLDALRGNEPGSPPGLAWKTGTSHGFRDTWACGVMGDWVLCVWVGNFDGKPMPGLFARDTAAPLLFQTLTRLHLRRTHEPRPPGIVNVQLCTITGELAQACCPHHTTGDFIAGVSPITTCTVHREMVVHGAREVREFWPAHRLEQFRRAGLPRANGAERPDGQVIAGPPPRIVSPQHKLTYVMRRDSNAQNAIALEADAAVGAREIHWFAGTRYLGASAPSHPLMWQASPGRWQIQAVDDSGRVATTAVTVVAAQ